MKDYLIALAVLLVLVAAFSTIESRVEFEYPFGNWAVPGNTGQPVPGEEEPGDVNAFTFGSAEQAAANQPGSQETADFCPITVTVVTEPETKEKNTETWGYALVGILSAHLTACWVFAVDAYVRYFKEKRRNNL